jgi:hypothetical protein
MPGSKDSLWIRKLVIAGAQVVVSNHLEADGAFTDVGWDFGGASSHLQLFPDFEPTRLDSGADIFAQQDLILRAQQEGSCGFALAHLAIPCGIAKTGAI